LGYLLYLFVVTGHLLAGNGVVFGTAVACIDDQFTECTEATVAADGKEWSVKERMILT